MPRPATRLLSTIASVCACALAGVAHVSHQSAATGLRIIPASFERGPSGAAAMAIVRAAVAEPSRFVSIVAADIDADGDIDVVASDSSLHLHIWVNDGSGHFTARQPEKSQGLRADPSPSFDVGSNGSDSSTQNDPPSLRAVGRTMFDVLAASTAPLRRMDLTIPAADRSASEPRAPPLSSL